MNHVMVEELETIAAPDAIDDFIQGFAFGALVAGAILCGGV